MDDEQQFCLKWNNHQSTLVSVFDSLLRRSQLLDCTLAAEGRSLKAHKVILSACSPYFESVLADLYDQHPVFFLKDVKFKELEAMMDYMYRGEVNVSQDQLGPLLKAAESLQIKGLSDNRRGETRTNNEERRREPPAAPPREKSPPPAPSLPQVKGLIIEQKKVETNNREGSQSPGRRRKRRRPSQDTDAGGDSSIENHDGASNASSSVSVSQPIVPPNVPLSESRSEISAASSVKTKTEETLPQVPVKQKLEPHTELMLEPKSEYIEEDMNEDSIEDLTLDDDDMDMDHSRPGPSHGGQGDGSNQGFGSWQMDPSQDETFMAAQEAVGQHRDAQELEDCEDIQGTTDSDFEPEFLEEDEDVKIGLEIERKKRCKKMRTDAENLHAKETLYSDSNSSAPLERSDASCDTSMHMENEFLRDSCDQTESNSKKDDDISSQDPNLYTISEFLGFGNANPMHYQNADEYLNAGGGNVVDRLVERHVARKRRVWPAHMKPRPGTRTSKAKCPKCGKIYSQLKNMKRHLRLECGIPPKFQCPFCPVKCKRNNQLTGHILAKHSVSIKVIPEDGCSSLQF